MNYQATHLRALLGVMLAAVVLALLFGRPGPAAQHSWLPSTYNTGPSGLRGLYETLVEAHWPVGKWQENFLSMPVGKDEVMIITRSPYGRKALFTQGEIDRLWAWMEGGRTLVLMGNFAEWDDTSYFLEKAGLPALSAPSSRNVFERSAAMLAAQRSTITLSPSPDVDADPTRAERRLSIVESPPLPVMPAPAPVFDHPRKMHDTVTVTEGANVLHGTLRDDHPTQLWVKDGAAHILERPVGQGRLVLASSPSLFDNEMLRNADNLWFVTQLLAPNGHAPAKVWFEEGHHGYRSSYAATDLLNQPGLRLAGVQVGLLVALFLASQMVRFGQIVPLERGRQRATLEFVHSMATLYQRANLRNDCIESLFRETHRRVLRKLNLPEGTSHDIVARQLAEAFPRLPKWKKLAGRFDRQDKDFVQGMAPGGWLKTAQDLVIIKNAMV